MLTLTRELLVQRLLELPALASAHAAQEPWFNERLLSWLKSVEDALLRLRHPVAGQIAVERTKLSAALDGHVPDAVRPERSNRRQVARAAALTSMQAAESAIQAIVAETDDRLEALNEKMVQLLAVISAAKPIPLQGSMSREVWLRTVWESVGTTVETRGMYNYLQAATSQSDLDVLLGDVLDRLVGLSRAATPADHAST